MERSNFKKSLLLSLYLKALINTPYIYKHDRKNIRSHRNTLTTLNTLLFNKSYDANVFSCVNDLNEEVVVQPDDTIVDESYKTFADNLVKNNDIHIFDHNGTNSVLISVEGSHLTVSDLDENGSESVFAESDNIIGAYPVKIGNGSVPYVYLIKEDGSVARIDISDRGARVIENLDEFERIVSVFGDGDLTAHLIDINGNIFKHY